MKITTLVILTLVFILDASGAVLANNMVEMTETFQSGSTFIGELTFSEDWTSLISVDGILSGKNLRGSSYNDSHINWVWWGSKYKNHGSGYSDFILDGVEGKGYNHAIEIDWRADGGSLVLDDTHTSINCGRLSNAIDYTDQMVSYHIGGSESSAVPEPATMVLFGIGLLGLSRLKKK